MRTTTTSTFLIAMTISTGLAATPALARAQSAPPRPSVFQTTLEEAGQKTPEITTDDLLKILAEGKIPVIDVRTAEEYAIAHIPGSINVYELEVQRITGMFGPGQDMILYCNGPSCGKSKRTSEDLVKLGYTNIRRYQLGMPVWRALSQTVQTDMGGLDYMFTRDGTAVFVDARTPAEFSAASMPNAVNIQVGEATAANDDGRLPFRDKGTRVVVFGNTPQQARVVAAEIAKKAYWNSSFFGGTFVDLLAGGYINHPPLASARSLTIAAGSTCTALVAASDVDNGSSDPDPGDTLRLSLDVTGPLGLGAHAVTLTVSDRFGRSASAAATVAVTDQTAPAIGNVSVSRPAPSPADHGLKIVTVNYEASDNCGGVTVRLGITREDGRSDEARVLDSQHVLVPGGHGRDTWITIEATDAAGNVTTTRVPVRGDDD